MNRNLYNVLIAIIWITLFIVIGTLFIKLLPYLIGVAIITWVVKRIARYFKEKKEQKEGIKQPNDFNSEDDKDVMDVDYTEVKK